MASATSDANEGPDPSMNVSISSTDQEADSGSEDGETSSGSASGEQLLSDGEPLPSPSSSHATGVDGETSSGSD